MMVKEPMASRNTVGEILRIVLQVSIYVCIGLERRRKEEDE